MERILHVIVLFLSVKMGTSMPQGVEPGRIYTPDDLSELRAAIAYEECLRTVGCDPGPQHNLACQLRSGADGMMKDVVDTRTNKGCNPMISQVLWPATGQCVQLLTQGPCPPGHWVQISETRGEPECSRRPCREGETLIGASQCHDLQDATMCPGGQQLLINEFGRAECDCAPGKVYHQISNDCYTPYTQGPCRTGRIIKVIDSGASGRAECVDNPCPRESMVPLDSGCHVSTRLGPGTACHALETQGPCVNGFLTVDESLSEPVCLETHSIFNLPNAKNCHRGSKRDQNGRCRSSFNLSRTLPPVVTSRPGIRPNGVLCPPGQVLMAGLCIKLALS